MAPRGSHVVQSNKILQCCFSDCSLKRPQDEGRYLILSIPQHILEVIKMHLGLFLNTLLPEFDRWEHLLLLLKGKVNTRKRSKVYRIPCMNLLAVEVLNSPLFTLAGCSH